MFVIALHVKAIINTIQTYVFGYKHYENINYRLIYTAIKFQFTKRYNNLMISSKGVDGFSPVFLVDMTLKRDSYELEIH